MKKTIFMTMLLLGIMVFAKAQNDTTFYVNNMESYVDVCTNKYDRALIYAAENCNDFMWRINYGGEDHYENPIVITQDMGYYGGDECIIEYGGCDYSYTRIIHFTSTNVPVPATLQIWKRYNEIMAIEPVGADSLEMYDFHWSTGETTPTIEVSEPGIYTCGISDQCATATRTFIVRDNVEIYRSGVDPATNKNRVLWQTTPEQAEYISSVKIDRDGMVVGTVPYLDGQFIDIIGSENAARIYRITGIASDGTECPLPSYRFGTFNTIISPDIANPSLMNFTWEDPFIEEGSSYSVAAYRIGRFNESTGEFVAIDQLSAQVHLGKYNMDLFEGDYGIVAAVFNDAKNRNYEELAFSNRSDSGIVGVEENGPSTGSGATRTLTVYPNPANNVLFVETRRATSLQGETYRIMNPLGQTLMEGQITTEKQQIDVRNLTKGLYFITVGDATRKFVVE
ncbi:MAG: T9SS type A sorting domain-containing protein [Bacteroidales bacterium]|nr:T9SS type A sorting domain-containing protein [Bacteroidales bacterium]